MYIFQVLWVVLSTDKFTCARKKGIDLTIRAGFVHGTCAENIFAQLKKRCYLCKKYSTDEKRIWK